MNEKLIEAAQAVIARWDSPLWKDFPHTAEFIHKLREAVADYSQVVPNGWIDVNDRLPELIEGKQHSEKVMGIYTGENYKKETIFCVGTFALLAVYDDKKWIKASNALLPVKPRDIAYGDTEDVTHWMPLTLP